MCTTTMKAIATKARSIMVQSPSNLISLYIKDRNTVIRVRSHNSTTTHPIKIWLNTKQPVLKVILNRQVSNSYEFIKGLKMDD